MALITGVDPVYTAIAGDWQGFGPYLSLHRVAISGSHRGQGLAGKLLQAAVKEGSLLGYHDFRIDTYPLNERMEKTIFAAGFTYRGMIEFPIPNGTRKAYQLLV